MEEKRAIGQLICCLINENTLSKEEEHQIKDCLEEKERKRRRCLAGIIDDELSRNVEAGVISECAKEKNYLLYKRCFMGSRTGNMDASELSEMIIREFIEEAEESYGLDDYEMMCFMGLLQCGLNRMADENILNFVPDRRVYRHYIEAERGIIYIENPYSFSETESIKVWIDRHPDDIRGLVLGYFFTTDASLAEIVHMEKLDQGENSLVGQDIVKVNKNVRISKEKSRIVSKALKKCPTKEKYIFMVQKKGKWQRLNEKGIQLKLYYVCQELGITYRPIAKNEALIPKKSQ